MIKTHWDISHLGSRSSVWVADPLWKKCSTPHRLWKYTSLLNYRNCKVDVFTRQGHSGGTLVKPLLFHYIIGTCDVKQRSHADNIIVSLYGRRKTMTPRSPQEIRSHFKSKTKQKQVDTYKSAHLRKLKQRKKKKKPLSNYCLSTTHRRYDVRTDVLIFWESILHVDALNHLIKLIRPSMWR